MDSAARSSSTPSCRLICPSDSQQLALWRKRTQFTLDELDELLDHVEASVYRAKGNEKQKVLRIIEKVSELLGSTIDPDEMSEQRLPRKTDTVFQIKVTLMGIVPLIWRRIQTARLHPGRTS